MILVMASVSSEAARADEAGVSYWLPGRFGSLAATPQVPGWSMAEVYYHTSVSAFGNAAAAREIQVGRIPAAANVNLNLHLNAQADLILLNPTYTFATPVLGGQLAIGVTGLFGRSSADLAGTLTAAVGPLATTRTGSFGDSITSVGDLYPQATLKWNAGVHNFMSYVTGDIPVGAYSPSSLANLGIGHAAIDAGGGYTYFNQQAGHEFSAVAGFTPRAWRWSADRLPVSRRRHAGLSESRWVWRICSRESPGRLEYLVDVLDLSDGADQHRDAGPTGRDKIAALLAPSIVPRSRHYGPQPCRCPPFGRRPAISRRRFDTRAS
ncbi:hypothetical protein J2R80_007492 [Bradyrhizobium sp. USDA 4541]|nr:hypothetical protein [Bradyrhizobium sp. USDA 4541]